MRAQWKSPKLSGMLCQCMVTAVVAVVMWCDGVHCTIVLVVAQEVVASSSDSSVERRNSF